MLRRILAAVMAASLLLGFAAVPVAAVSHSCQPVWESTTKQFYGNSSRSTNSSILVTGAKATIDINSSTFKLCSTSGLPGDDMVTAWVSIQDVAGSNKNQILQIGIIKCNFDGVAGCSQNVPHFFWAYGGCNGDLATVRDLGVADGNAHTYEIARNNSGLYALYIDGVLKAGLSSATIGCWALTVNDVEAGWFVETNDDGDGSADVGDKLNFTNSYWRYTWYGSGSWYIPNLWQTSSCTFTEDTQYLDGKCDNLNAPGNFDVWSELL